jgi:phosphoglycolate phosphatase
MKKTFSPDQVTICFDLDGTLVNTAPDLLGALDHTLKSNGLATSNHEEITPIIGQGAMAMIRRALSSPCQDPANDERENPTFSDKEIETLWQSLIEHYTIHIADQSHPYPGVEEALARLREKQYRLAVCTNKPMFLTTPLLEKLELSAYFNAICGADSFPFKKPDPRHLTQTISKAGGKVQSGVLIGDSNTDVKTARAATLPVIGVPFGYSDTPMAALKPDALIFHFDELTEELIEKLLA